MSFLALPRHPAVRAALVAFVLVLLLLVTTTVVRTSTVDAQQAEIAALEAAASAAAAAEAREAAAAERAQAERDEVERLALLEVAQARETVVAAIAGAQTVLDGSIDRVADDSVRAALAAAIATANATLEAPLAELQAAASSLAVAQLAVSDAQAAWDTEQARLAAEAAAEKAAEDAAASTPAPRASAAPAPAPAPAAPQCVNDSTYVGPPFYTSAPGADGDGSNGNVPASQMTQLAWGHDSVGTPQYLRTPAARALDRLNAAYRARFGSDLNIDLTYRSYDGQVAMRNALGSIAAVPGTSTHGTGNALDVPEWSCYAFGSVRRDWLVANGPAYGWVSPSWARQGSSNPEYWHYEYTG